MPMHSMMKPIPEPTVQKSLSPRDWEIIAAYKRGGRLLSIADRFGVTCADVQRIVVRVGDLGRVLANLSHFDQTRSSRE
jgi:hypothetical protein